MADIELRFHHDMLVLSAPADAVLERQGINAARDRAYLNLMEPDVMRDALRLEVAAGAQCLVTPTEDITRARLSHVNMDGDAGQLASSVLDTANELKPQHVLVEIGPCGLPLDASSKASLNENRAQYADAARAFADGQFDGFLLSGFTNINDLKCALMGVAQVSGKPVFASVTVGSKNSDGDARAKQAASGDDDLRVLKDIAQAHPMKANGFDVIDDAPTPPAPAAYRTVLDPEMLPAAIDTMVDLGAAVVGFETAEPLDCALEYARIAVERTALPVLAQLRVPAQASESADRLRGLVPLEDINEYTPDTMELAAVKLCAAGVQFVRATGAATPAFTGALAATLQGVDVCRR